MLANANGLYASSQIPSMQAMLIDKYVLAMRDEELKKYVVGARFPNSK